MHSSKTMRPPTSKLAPSGRPALLAAAVQLVEYLRTLSDQQIAESMAVSKELAKKTLAQYAQWSSNTAQQHPAVTTFVGDLYSGLQVDTFDSGDRRYADEHLRVLSGLYGILRPYDGVCPYRLEMGYRLAPSPHTNLYQYWGDSIAAQLPAQGSIVNLAAKEYSKTVLPHVAPDRVITPKFLTVDAASGQPKFVVVHAKIARGAFARWLVATRRATPSALLDFNDLGYQYDAALSTPAAPAFVCREFGGKGLSVRRT